MKKIAPDQAVAGFGRWHLRLVGDAVRTLAPREGRVMEVQELPHPQQPFRAGKQRRTLQSQDQMSTRIKLYASIFSSPPRFRGFNARMFTPGKSPHEPFVRSSRRKE